MDVGAGLINGANLVGGLMRQGQQTQDYIDQMFDEAAKRKAATALARGDTAGAADALGSRGMVDQVDALKTRADTSQALNSIATGDFAAAKGAAARIGDPALFGQVSAQQTAEIKHRAEYMGNAADALAQVPQAQRPEAFGKFIAPTLKAMGMDDGQIQQIAASDFSDQSIAAFKASVGELTKLTIHQDPNTGDLLGVDPTTGAVKVLHKGQPKHEWKERQKADGSTEWVDLNSGDVTDTPPPEVEAETPHPSGGIYDRIGAVAAESGAKGGEVSYLQRLAQVESNGDPKAKNGSSTGIFQFHPDTFASVGGTNINDPADQTKAALALSRRDRQVLTAAGVEPTDANVYIMHQQGLGGGKALLTADPGTKAVDVLTPVYGSAAKAKQAITKNGGTESMTAGEFVDYWHRRWAGVKPSEAKKGLRTVPGDEAGAQEAPLTDEAVAMIGYQYLRNGPSALVNLGQGKAGVGNKNRILAWAAKTAKEAGTDNPELVSRFAESKAAQMALQQVTKVRTQVAASEATVDKNMQIVMALAPKGAGPTGAPLLNQPIQFLRKNLWGSADVAKFDAALGTVADEYAKVMTTATGAGGASLSDSARKEAYERLSRASTIPQLQGIVATLRAEMQNRVDSYRDQEKAALATISGQAAPAATAAVLPGGAQKVRAYNPKTGKLE